MRTSKTLACVGGAAAACLMVGLAIATPTVGAYYNTVIANGLVPLDINANATVALDDEDFTAGIHTYGASNVIVQNVKFSPGGTTGWHKHPGVVVLTLAADSGPVDWYDSHCGKVTYKAGDSWTEGTRLHDVVNNSTKNAHFIVTYIVADGENKRTDEEAPKCAAALGLN